MTKPAGFYHTGEQALGAALYMNRTVPSIPPSLPRNLDPISTYRSFKTSSASTDLFSLSFQTAAFLGGSVEAPLITSNLIFVPEPIKTHHSFGNTFLFFQCRHDGFHRPSVWPLQAWSGWNLSFFSGNSRLGRERYLYFPCHSFCGYSDLHST